MTRLSSIRAHYAHREDPYAGGDLDNAQRISTVLWGVLVVLVIGLLPVSPPHEPTVAAGWAINGVVLTLGVLLVLLTRRRRIPSWAVLLATGYGIVIGLAVLQWTSGGLAEPHERLLLLPVVFVAATQPPRQILVFLLFVLAVLMAPAIYDHWDSHWAGGALASFVIWCGLGIGGSLLMGGVRAQRLTHEEEKAEARHEARIDPLTGLHNRRAFDELLLSEMSRARRLDMPLSVAMVDIENFKEVNDRWSYGAGDRCLQDLAEVLRTNLRQPDFCFRWGGDEFALILSGTSADDTEPIAERLRTHVAQSCKRPDDSPLRIRFAVAELRDGISPAELTEMAGMALTASKLDAAR